MAKHNLKRMLLPAILLTAYISAFAQPLMAQPLATPDAPPIEPGVSLTLAKWRAERYSDVRYKLNLTLEKMSPVLKGTMEVRVRVAKKGSWGVKESVPPAVSGGGTAQAETRPVGSVPDIVLDWRKIKGHEEKSTISNVSVNGRPVTITSSPPATVGGTDMSYSEENEHLIFRDGVVLGENVIKLDFTSPILTSGSAITRYVDKEDGAEYIYSLFVPSDASTAFPVFDQPDLKGRFELSVWQRIDLIVEEKEPIKWRVISNEDGKSYTEAYRKAIYDVTRFPETKPISTYVFAFAAGPWEKVEHTGGNPSRSEGVSSPADKNTLPTGRVSASGVSSPHVNKGSTRSIGNDEPSLTVGLQTPSTNIYVRKSQAAKFKPHAAEVFRLNREAVKYFEQYFDYKFPFPKYDLVLIPEFPFGGMEHAGATFLRESSIIFPQEPTKNDLVSRATLIFHEAAHQWFGDTVTMRWFDDLWLKEGFATFMGYKALEKIMPEMKAWKVFYERVKQGAYQTDSTRGTTAIYQPIANLSAAKSAYGNIVYNKAPAFLRQAEFYLGEDKFRTAVRAFLKKHEFGNAGWEDLVREFGASSGRGDVGGWAERWVLQKGMPVIRASRHKETSYCLDQSDILRNAASWPMKTQVLLKDAFGNDGDRIQAEELFTAPISDKPIQTPVDRIFRPKPLTVCAYPLSHVLEPKILFPNYGDYGYGIFLLDAKSREYVLKNIQNEKDPFLRSMMWGALWDSVREGELDPRTYIELVIKNFPTEKDETITSSILGRATMALNYYVADKTRNELVPKFEYGLIDRLTRAETAGQRITIYRALLNVVATASGQDALKAMLKASLEPQRNVGPKPFTPGLYSSEDVERILRFEEMLRKLPLKTKDRFDIFTRLLILGDPAAPKLLAELEKTETSDDAKRYAYAARAGIGTAENKAKYWNDFVSNKEISESWIEAAFGPWNSIRHSELTLPYLQKALQELPNHKRNRKIFFVNGWLGAFIGGQRSEEALAVVNKFLADNPGLDNDLRLKILENADIIERAVKIRKRWNDQ